MKKEVHRKTKGRAMMLGRVDLNKHCPQKLAVKVDSLKTQGRCQAPGHRNMTSPCARLEKRTETFTPLGRFATADHHWGSY